MKYLSLKENLQQARKVLKKHDEDEDSLHFKRIRKMVEDIFGNNQLGFLGLATRFSYDGKLNIDNLREIFIEIKNNKNLLKKLPKQVVNYKNPEKLLDDITSLKEWATYNKEFVQRLKGDFKKSAREDRELKDAYIGLDNDVRIDLISNFLPKIARYKSYEDFRIAVFNYLSSPDKSEEIISKIDNTDGINIVYNEGGVIVAEVFTYKASCALGSKSWCISTGQNWWNNYNSIDSGNKQYFVWNLNVPSTNINSRVGVTIKPNGSVHASHLKNDSAVNFGNYIEKYSIDKDIFKPLDTEDLDQLIKYHGLSTKVISFISKKENGKKVLMNYKDQIPKMQAMLLGLLSEEELKNLPQMKSMIYSNERHKDLEQVIYYCNIIDDMDDMKKKNKTFYKIISEMSFLDKIVLIDKYHEPSYRNDDKINFSDSGIEVFLEREISNSEYPLSVETQSFNSNITFEFEMDKDEYIETILNTDEEYYYGLLGISSHDTYYLTSVTENEEDNYLHRYFNDENMDLLKKYFEKLKKYIVHTEVIKRIDDFVKDRWSVDDGFRGFAEMVQLYDPKFNWDTWKNGESYFYDFVQELENAAQDVVSEDSQEWENKSIGEFDESTRSVGYYSTARTETRSTYTVTSSEILESINLESIKDDLSINEWLESSPSDVNRMNFKFYDYPHASTYLGEADTTLANDKLKEELEEVIDNEIFEDVDEREEAEDIAKYEKKLLDNGYKSYVEDKWNDKVYYYGLKFENKGEVVDVEYEEGEETIIKREKQDLYYVIDKKSISPNGSCWLYMLKKPYKYYVDKQYSNNLSDMFKKDKKELIEMGIDVRNIQIGESIIDPNQLKFKFEGIKSFNSFKQSKLRRYNS